MNTLCEPRRFSCRTINGNTGYFHFLENASQEDFAAAFEDYLEIVTDVNVSRLMVAVDLNSDWNDSIENLWLKTAELAEQFEIRKWGIVSPDSEIWTTLRRVVHRNNLLTHPKYEFLLSDNKSEVLNWLRES